MARVLPLCHPSVAIWRAPGSKPYWRAFKCAKFILGVMVTSVILTAATTTAAVAWLPPKRPTQLSLAAVVADMEPVLMQRESLTAARTRSSAKGNAK